MQNSRFHESEKILAMQEATYYKIIQNILQTRNAWINEMVILIKDVRDHP